MVLSYTLLFAATSWCKPLLSRWPMVWFSMLCVCLTSTAFWEESWVARTLRAGQQRVLDGAKAWHRVTGARGWRHSSADKTIVGLTARRLAGKVASRFKSQGVTTEARADYAAACAALAAAVLGRVEADYLSWRARCAAAAALMYVIAAAPVGPSERTRIMCAFMAVWAVLSGGGVWAVAGAAARARRLTLAAAHAPRATGGVLAMYEHDHAGMTDACVAALKRVSLPRGP